MEKSKELCRGCYNDFYNYGNNSPSGECWSYESAEVVEKCFVHVSMVPPWRVDPETTLSCCRKKNHVAVDPTHPQVTTNEDHVQEYDGGDYR